MPFLLLRQSVNVNIPQGSVIRIGNKFGCNVEVLVQNPTIAGLRANGPTVKIPRSTGVDVAYGTVLGPYPTDQLLTIVAGDAVIEYQVAATPALSVLSDQAFNGGASGVAAITSGSIAGTNISSSAIAGSTVNGSAIGGTAPSTGRFTSLGVPTTDSSGIPGNATSLTTRGRAAFPATGQFVTITNSFVGPTSMVIVTLSATDTALTSTRVTLAAGSFTVTGNAAAAGITTFDYLIINS
jgi:hypothetical protein